ncbi:MAG: hypothetical protein JST11_09425 [Acidobacteria bacterium]|nr:hypothetical protein [Acidobacteriota bacterium]
MSRWLCALVVASTCCAADLRQEVLQAIFPGMEVVTTTRHRDDSWKDGEIRYPDALAAEAIFQVNGAPANEIEQRAAEVLGEGKWSRRREVRVRVIERPRSESDLLAVVQYRFIAARPAMAYWSIPLLVHLERTGNRWKVVEQRLFETAHHGMIPGLRMVDVTGDDVADLVLETDFGGGGHLSWLIVFDLSGHSFRPIMQVCSRSETWDVYSQILDVPRSVAQAGRAICFELTTFVKEGKIFPTPRVSHECYPTGTGVDGREIERLNHQLRPVIQ